MVVQFNNANVAAMRSEMKEAVDRAAVSPASPLLAIAPGPTRILRSSMSLSMAGPSSRKASHVSWRTLSGVD